MRSRISSPVVSFTSEFPMHTVDVSSTNGLECISSVYIMILPAMGAAVARLSHF